MRGVCGCMCAYIYTTTCVYMKYITSRLCSPKNIKLYSSCSTYTGVLLPLDLYPHPFSRKARDISCHFCVTVEWRRERGKRDLLASVWWVRDGVGSFLLQSWLLFRLCNASVFAGRPHCAWKSASLGPPQMGSCLKGKTYSLIHSLTHSFPGNTSPVVW